VPERGRGIGAIALIVLLGVVVIAVAPQWREREAARLRDESRGRITAWADNTKRTGVRTRSPWPPVQRLGPTTKQVNDYAFDPSKGMSEACSELNRRVVRDMRAFQLAGAPPPFQLDPLMEILRTGRCGPSEPSVRVLGVWLVDGAERSGVTLKALTPRSSGRSP
jgi:hypothetical protein